MGEVRHVALYISHTEEELDHAVADHKVLSPNRYGDEEEVDRRIRVEPAEGEQEPKDSPRSADRQELIDAMREPSGKAITSYPATSRTVVKPQTSSCESAAVSPQTR